MRTCNRFLLVALVFAMVSGFSSGAFAKSVTYLLDTPGVV